MKAKNFFLTVLIGTLLCFGALIFSVTQEDPFFVLKGIDGDGTAIFDNQRYEMAGLIRHQDYEAVVMGTSLVANYHASWFTEGLGVPTLKITYPDGWVTEFDTALHLAFRTHPELKTVYFGFDPNIMIRSDSSRTVELPVYLYNLNPLDDVEYLLNADTYSLMARTWIERQKGGTLTLDDAYIWDGRSLFSREMAIKCYPRPEIAGTKLEPDAYLEAVQENLEVVCRWFEEHPDVEFTLWFPPYSILYWDRQARIGATDALLSAIQYASERLLEYPNVSLYCFLDSTDVITDLDNYTDHIHCSSNVTHWEADCMLNGEGQLTYDNLYTRLHDLREFTENYDYEAIFDTREESA